MKFVEAVRVVTECGVQLLLNVCKRADMSITTGQGRLGLGDMMSGISCVRATDTDFYL